MDKNVFDVIKNSFTNIINEDTEGFISTIEAMSKRFISLKDTQVTSRNFNHWKEEGLIDYVTTEKRVKLSLFEYMWVKAISIMRNFGMPINSIKAVKDLLNLDVFKYMLELQDKYSEKEFKEIIGHFATDKANSDDVLNLISNYNSYAKEDMFAFSNTLFNFAIISCLISRERADIIITENNEAFMLLESTYGFLEAHYGAEHIKVLEQLLTMPHLRINLNYLIYDYINAENRADFIVNKHIFSSSELLMINILKRKNVSKIEVTKENKGGQYKIDIMSYTQLDEDKSNVIKELLELGKYDSINLKEENNNLLNVKRKTTTKIKS